jgi:hypothetical protein
LRHREHGYTRPIRTFAEAAAVQRRAQSKFITKKWGTTMPQGVTSASLIVIILVASAVGAIVGGILGQFGLDVVPLAIVSGFIATIVAVVVRNELLNRLSGAGPDDFRIPMVVAVFAIIASLAGSLAGKEILDDVGGTYSAVWTGTVAGLVSAILMSLLMITYHMYPDQRAK